MMKFLKNINILLIILLLLNLITWFFFGKSLSLKIAANEFKTNGKYYADTIHLFTGKDELSWYKSQYADFSPNSKERFVKELSSKTKNLILHNEKFEDRQMIVNTWLTNDNCIYDFELNNSIPFYLVINGGTLAGGGSVEFKSYYIWFFKWWKLDERLIAES